MASETEISNLAISHLGIGKEIGDLETENSSEARACRRFFDVSKYATMRSFPWSFLKRSVALGLVEENPTTEWLYSYRYPSTALGLIKILSGVRIDTPDSRINYAIVSDATGKLIHTDEQDAVCLYLETIDDTTLYPYDFIMAFSYKLAYNISAIVTAGDPFNIRTDMEKNFSFEISKASKNDLNEQYSGATLDSELITIRE